MLALSEDFPRLWNAPTTKTKDRKRILRLLIKDITVERATDRKLVVLHLRWQGGANEDIQVALPPNIADRLRYPKEIVQRIRELALKLPDAQIAEALNGEGRRPAKAKAFNVSMVKWIRYKHHIPAADLKRPEELTVRQVTDKLGVSRGVVYYWIERGVIEARRMNNGSPYWVSLTPEKENELREWVRGSTKIQKLRQQSETKL